MYAHARHDKQSPNLDVIATPYGLHRLFSSVFLEDLQVKQPHGSFINISLFHVQGVAGTNQGASDIPVPLCYMSDPYYHIVRAQYVY